jgi:hypothetical protein
MTHSQKANDLQIKPLDENATVPTNPMQRPDPRVAEFLERLRKKAEALDTVQRENHVTAKEPRRRPIVEQAANPDWYQPQPAKKAAPSVSFVKRFVGAPKRKASTG